MVRHKTRLKRKAGLFPKKTMRLEKQMAIVVPSTKEFNKQITKKEMVNRVRSVRNFLTENFGGSTRVKGIGSYSGKGGVVDENVVVVEAFADNPVWNKSKSSVSKFLRQKAREWSQESLGYQLEGDLYLVEP